MRRLFFLILVTFTILLIVRRASNLKRTRELLIEDILKSLEKEYRESPEASPELLLGRLREIRRRYGDKIAQEITERLKEKLNGRESEQNE